MEKSKLLSPIFEVGVARSGTTLLSLMLDGHSRLAIPYESHFFVDYHRRRADVEKQLESPEGRLHVVESILREPYVQRWDWTPTVESVDLSRCTDLPNTIAAVYTAYAEHHKADIWGDKTPLYITHINVLNDLFPDAKYIHLVRDGRDVALSLMKQWFGPNDLVSALEYWRDSIRLGSRMLAMLPKDRVFTLKLEDLVSAPEHHLRQLCEFIGIDFEPEMIESFSSRARDKVGTRIGEHHAGLASSLSIEKVTRWPIDLSPSDQAVAWEVAGTQLTEFGYPAGVTRHWAKGFRRFTIAFLKRISGARIVGGVHCQPAANNSESYVYS